MTASRASVQSRLTARPALLNVAATCRVGRTEESVRRHRSSTGVSPRTTVVAPAPARASCATATAGPGASARRCAARPRGARDHDVDLLSRSRRTSTERRLSSMVAGSPDRRLEPVRSGESATGCGGRARRRGAARSPRLRLPRFSAIWVATALLFAVSPLLASGQPDAAARCSRCCRSRRSSRSPRSARRS